MIDQVISVEILNADISLDLFEVVLKNVIHVPCDLFNNNSPWMFDGKCTKEYPKDIKAVVNEQIYLTIFFVKFCYY